jgi:NAD(P)H-dependent FMN reductase
MKKILAIGGSNSRISINRKLANSTALLFKDSSVGFYDLSLVDLPIFSVQLEEANGIPDLVMDFAKLIDEADFLLLSLAENNGYLNVGFKNLLDWTSRIKGRKTFAYKPMLLMATSPGQRGGSSVLEIAKNIFQRQGAIIKGTFSLPSFYQNFDDETGITNQELLNALQSMIAEINQSL